MIYRSDFSLVVQHRWNVFQCDFIFFNDLFLSPSNISQRLAVFVIILHLAVLSSAFSCAL